MKIGTLHFEVPIFLAPMAGVTDTAYRIIAHDMGCELVYSEMVSTSGINYHNQHTLAMLKTECTERPLAMQLFGHDPESVAKAATYVESLGVTDIIDFNMGCPAPKIVKNGEGAALMREPKRAEAILRALKKAVSIPVTVKMRKGWDAGSINVVDMSKRAEDAGVDAIAVHGRTREEYYRGQADWEAIAKVKAAINIPVIANGDVRTTKDLAKILAVTKADAVMIGRGAQGNPWIFRQLREFFLTGKELPPPTLAERAEIIKRHLNMLIAYKGAYIGAREMRKHATWYTRGLAHSAELRQAFNRAETYEDFENIIENYLYSQSEKLAI